MSNLPPNAKPAGHNEYQLPCPQCNNPKNRFCWNDQKLQGVCKHCGFKISGQKRFDDAFGGVESFQTVHVAPSWRTPGRVALGEPLPNNDEPSSRVLGRGNGYYPAFQVPEAAEYLLGRRVDQDLAEEVGILYQGGRVWFPVWSPTGMQPFLMGRSLDPNENIRWKGFPASKGHYLFGRAPEGDICLVCEGVFHVLAPGLWGKALATLGAQVSVDMAVWLGQRYRKIVLIPDTGDRDDKGVKGYQTLESIILGWFPTTRVITVVLLKELGNHGPEEIKKCLSPSLSSVVADLGSRSPLENWYSEIFG